MRWKSLSLRIRQRESVDGSFFLTDVGRLSYINLVVGRWMVIETLWRNMEQTRQSNKYNGWTNYETWAVNLWLENEEPTYRYWREQARWHREHASESSQVAGGTWTADEVARIELAKQFETEISESSPLTALTVYSDLLNAALEEVNWNEIAESWLSEE